MSRLLLIAVCCLLAAVCLFESVQGKSCMKRCKASCGDRLQNRKNCEQSAPVRPAVQCLAGIQVLYADHIVFEPQETIKEFHRGDNNVNDGFSNGFVVWLTALWQSGRDNAVTGIDIIITGTENVSYSDVSMGDGLTDYRYLNLVREPSLPCINQITLWRADNDIQTPDVDGWQGYSTDINDGRGGSYLYLAWKFA